MADRSDDEVRRESSGWGRRGPTPRTDPFEREDRPAERAADLEESAGAGAISGRGVTRQPQELAPGDTLGGSDQPEAEDNLAQDDPLSGNPPTP